MTTRRTYILKKLSAYHGFMLTSLLLICLLFLLGRSVKVQAAESIKAPAKAENLVLFVSFADTEEDYWNKNTRYADTAKIIQTRADKIYALYNSEEVAQGAAISMKQYFSVISGDKFQIENVMPQMSVKQEKDGKDHYSITPITVSGRQSSYVNTYDAKLSLMKEVLQKLNENSSFLAKLPGSLDANGDSFADNITFVFAVDSVEDRGSIFFAHKSSMDGQVSDGLKVKNMPMNNYNILNAGNFGGLSGVGVSTVLCHEFLHVLGALDTYTNDGRGVIGCWDIMASTGNNPQYPLAWTRRELGWASMKEVRLDATNTSGTYTLRTPAVSSSDYAMVVRTPYSNDEVFVIEYRKQGDSYKTDVKDKMDRNIGGSGLIVYRVNLKAESWSNTRANYIYLFREGEGESEATNTGAATGGYFSDGLSGADNYSSQAVRTSFGSASPEATSKEGAITYIDGTNSGLIIKNIGKAGGDNITFELEYHGEAIDGKWQTEEFENASVEYSYETSMALLGDRIYAGNLDIAVLHNKVYGLASTSESNYRPALLCYENGKWQRKKILCEEQSSDMSLLQGNDESLYVSCIVANTGMIKIFRVDENEKVEEITENINTLGKHQSVKLAAANPKLAATSDGVMLVYRDYYNSDKIYAYRRTQTEWELLDTDGAAGNSFAVYGKGKKVCIAVADNKTDGESYVYTNTYPQNSFKKIAKPFLKGQATTASAAIDANGVVYAAAYSAKDNQMEVKGYRNGNWERLGLNVFSRMPIGIWLSVEQKKVYALCQYTEGELEVKSHLIFDPDTIQPTNPGEKPGEGEKPNESEKPGEGEKPTEPKKPAAEAGKTTQSEQKTNTANPVVKAGTTFSDKKTQARYKVLTVGKKKTAEYVRSLNKKRKTAQIPATITWKKQKYSVVSIGAGAFKKHTALIKVTVGKNVTKIKSKAFFGCKKLTRLNLKTKKLTKKSIGKQAFAKINKKCIIKAPQNKKKLYNNLIH